MPGLVPAALFAFAFGVRALAWPWILGATRTYFPDPDAWYHMRRIAFTLERWPALLGFDPYLNHPDGARAIWPATFDAAAAALALPFFRAGGLAAAERLAAWLPVLLGAATVLALHRLARRTFDRSAALVAGGVLAVTWGHVSYSRLGMVDHHVAVALLSTGLLAAAMGFVAREAAGPLGRRAATLGAALGALLLVWPGGLLHVAIVELGIAVSLLAGPCDEARRRGWAAAGANAIAFGMLLPPALWNDWPQWGPFSPNVLSGFQPWLFGSTGLFFAGCAAWLGRPTAARSRRVRLVGVAAIGLVLAVASAGLLPELLAGLADAWQWIARDEVFQQMVSESRPLFSQAGGADPAFARKTLSSFVYVAPIAIAALAVWARSRPDPAPIWLLATWSVVLLAATLVQARFCNSASVALALVFGWSAVEGARALQGRFARSRVARRGIALGVTLVGLGLLWPTLAMHAIPLRNAALALRGQPLPLSILHAHTLALVRTAEWLRDHTPPTSGFFDSSVSPAYGVMAHWQYGHALKYLARRPTVVGNFGDDVGGDHLERSLDALSRSEPRAAETFEALGVRYVVARALDWQGLTRDEDALAHTLGRADLRDLGRHRLLFEVPVRPSGRESVASHFRVFELVAGASILGRAPPGAEVRAWLPYRSNTGRESVARVTTAADAEGHYTLRLAQPTRGGTPAIASASGWRIAAGDAEGAVSIDEADVRAGVRLAGPDLR